jgi:hypothetical protein
MQQRECPGHGADQNVANRFNRHFFAPFNRASAGLEMANQLYEKYDQMCGADLGMSEKILRCGRLSGRMYKIRTLLSTDIVDNVVGLTRGAGRKPLLHAARGASPPGVWHGGR